MKGFITLKNAPLQFGEKDDNTYYVNISSISHFHEMDMSFIEHAFNASGISVNEENLPRTIVYLNSKDYKGEQVIFRITLSVGELTKQIEAAQS